MGCEPLELAPTLRSLQPAIPRTPPRQRAAWPQAPSRNHAEHAFGLVGLVARAQVARTGDTRGDAYLEVLDRALEDGMINDNEATVLRELLSAGDSLPSASASCTLTPLMRSHLPLARGRMTTLLTQIFGTNWITCLRSSATVTRGRQRKLGLTVLTTGQPALICLLTATRYGRSAGPLLELRDSYGCSDPIDGVVDFIHDISLSKVSLDLAMKTTSC